MIFDKSKLKASIRRELMARLSLQWDFVELLWRASGNVKGRDRKKLAQCAKLQEKTYFEMVAGMFPMEPDIEQCERVVRDRLARGLTTPEDPELYKMVKEENAERAKEFTEASMKIKKMNQKADEKRHAK